MLMRDAQIELLRLERLARTVSSLMMKADRELLANTDPSTCLNEALGQCADLWHRIDELRQAIQGAL